jgi:Ca2+-binding RTX toxin-like protein
MEYWQIEAGAQGALSAGAVVNNAPPLVVGPVDLGSNLEDWAMIITAADLLANASDADAGDILTVLGLAVDPAFGSIIDNGDGSFNFLPLTNYNGPVTFSYTVSDGNDQSSATASLTITPVNDAPVISGVIDLGNVVQSPFGFPVTIDKALLLAAASDVDGDTLSIIAATLDDPQVGSLLGGGLVMLFLNPAFSGVASLTYYVSDGTALTSGRAVMNILPINLSPQLIAPLGPFTATEDSLFSIDLDDYFSDPEGQQLTYQPSITLPIWLTLDATTGILSGTPTNSDVGGYDLYISATDSQSGLGLPFTLSVANTNDAPIDIIGNLRSIPEFVGTGVSVGVLGGIDPDVDMLTYALVNDADGRFAIDVATGRVTVANPTLINFEAADSHLIRVRTTDTSGLSFEKDFAISITDVAEAPESLSRVSGGSVVENAANGTIVAQLVGTDPDFGSTLRYSLFDDAGGRFAIDAVTGVVTVANGAALDFEASPSHIIGARVSDAGGYWLDQSFSIMLTDVVEYNIINGSASNNKLIGSGLADMISGFAGNDTLIGNGGDDILIGGAGADRMTGGDGHDIFRFQALTDSPRGGRDTILDFGAADGANHDVIDLSLIDANANIAGDQAFMFIGAAKFGREAGQLRFDGSSLLGDVNGDGKADFEIALSTPLPQQLLDITDFIL